MKKIIPIILSLTAVMSTSTALAEENITVMLNGQAMDFDVAPIIQNDRVLVPMRAIYYKFVIFFWSKSHLGKCFPQKFGTVTALYDKSLFKIRLKCRH